MEDELALPSQRDDAAPDEQEEEEEEAMADAEDPATDDDDRAAGDAEPAEGELEGNLPDGAAVAPSAPESEDPEAKSGGNSVTPSSTPAEASGPRDVLETSGAEAARPAGALTDGAWSNWSRSSLADPKQAPPGNIVRTSGPAEMAEVERFTIDRRDGSKLRSPAQRMVEGSDRAVGRWRAKTAAPVEASGEAAADSLRGVTAQPGNPLR